MTIPEPQGRPIWEPMIIALFLVVLLTYDGDEILALIQGRAPITGMARAALELGAAAMTAWGLVTSLNRMIRWGAESEDEDLG